MVGRVRPAGCRSNRRPGRRGVDELTTPRQLRWEVRSGRTPWRQTISGLAPASPDDHTLVLRPGAKPYLQVTAMGQLQRTSGDGGFEDRPVRRPDHKPTDTPAPRQVPPQPGAARTTQQVAEAYPPSREYTSPVISGRTRWQAHSSTRRSLSALAMTDTELNVIAALASIGLSNSPNTG